MPQIDIVHSVVVEGLGEGERIAGPVAQTKQAIHRRQRTVPTEHQRNEYEHSSEKGGRSPDAEPARFGTLACEIVSARTTPAKGVTVNGRPWTDYKGIEKP